MFQSLSFLTRGIKRDFAMSLPGPAWAADSTTPTAQRHKLGQWARHGPWPSGQNLCEISGAVSPGCCLCAPFLRLHRERGRWNLRPSKLFGWTTSPEKSLVRNMGEMGELESFGESLGFLLESLPRLNWNAIDPAHQLPNHWYAKGH